MTEEWDIDQQGFHPYADIFPNMTDGEFAQFVDDVGQRGLIFPIVTTPDGQILDGRHRYRACMELKIKPRYQVHVGDPLSYVLSVNLHRRHLTESQRAMVGARAANVAHGGSNPGKSLTSETTKRGIPTRSTTDGKPAVTMTDAAKAVGVHRDSVQSASNVLKKGVPELVTLVDEGKVTVSRANLVVKENDDERQLEWVRDVRSGVIKPKIHKAIVPKREWTPRARPSSKVSKSVFSAKDAQGLNNHMVAIELAFDDITEVSHDVTPEMISELVKGVTKAKSVLSKLVALLKNVEE